MPDLTADLPLKAAADYADPRQPTRVLPLVYGDLTVGGEGGVYQAVCLDAASRIYALAGHPLLPLDSGGAVALYDKNGDYIPQADYTLDPAHNLDGLGVIATARFAADARDREPIGVAARGKPDPDGGLLENPALVARDLIVEVCGATETEVNPTALGRAASRAAALGFRAAGTFSRRLSLGRALTELWGGFLGSWWTGGNGRLRLGLDLGPGSLTEAELAHAFRQADLRGVVVEARLDEVVNQVRVHYRYSHLSGEYGAVYQGEDGRDPAAQGLYGVRERIVEMPWVREEPVARAIAARLLALHKEPRRVISFEDVSRASQVLERGDAALFGLSWLCDAGGRPLVNQIARVLSVQPQLDAGTTRFSLLDTGYYKTVAFAADGGFTAGGGVLAGGLRDRAVY